MPEFDWVVDILKHWLSPAGRELFPTADRSRSLWPSERSGNASLRTFERTFARARDQAGLPEELTLHCLRRRSRDLSAARLDTLHELTKLASTAIIAEVLGYSAATIENHAVGSAANYATYIQARLDAELSR